ncbi:MAG: hypothetical protein ACK52I_24860, partial [Pseudomonadota bacterium]
MIFKGNFPHAGPKWADCSGCRLHFYLDSKKYPAKITENGYHGLIYPPIKIICSHPKFYCLILSIYETKSLHDFILKLPTPSLQDPKLIDFFCKSFQELRKQQEKNLTKVLKEAEFIQLMEEDNNFEPLKYFLSLCNELDIYECLQLGHMLIFKNCDNRKIPRPSKIKIEYCEMNKKKFTDPIIQMKIKDLERIPFFITQKKQKNYSYELYLLIRKHEVQNHFLIYSKNFHQRDQWFLRTTYQDDIQMIDIKDRFFRNENRDIECVFYRRID